VPLFSTYRGKRASIATNNFSRPAQSAIDSRRDEQRRFPLDTAGRDRDNSLPFSISIPDPARSADKNVSDGLAIS
jgi:hypothetical protein